MGAFLLEVDAHADPAALFAGLEYRVVGAVLSQPTLEIASAGQSARASLAELEAVWAAPFLEVTG